MFTERAILAVCALALGACGSSDDAANPGATCATDTFTLKGELGAEPVDLELPLGNFTLYVLQPGPTHVEFGTQGALDLDHATPLEVGKAAPATGTLTLPSEAPHHAGETLCAGQGSTFTFAVNRADREAYTFQLKGLASGAQCDSPLAGALEGCFAPSYQ